MGANNKSPVASSKAMQANDQMWYWVRVRGGRGEALLLGERGRAPRVAVLLLLFRHGRLGHRRRGRRPFGRRRRSGGRGRGRGRDDDGVGVGRRLPGSAAPTLRRRRGPVLLADASRRRRAVLLLLLLGGIQALLEVRVPDVLDLVVRPPGQPGGDGGPPSNSEERERAEEREARAAAATNPSVGGCGCG